MNMRVTDEPAVPLDDSSWEEIARQHSAEIYRYAFSLTGNPHDAADLTQDVFVKVFRSLSKFSDEKGTLTSWIHRITTNSFVDRVRRERRIRFEAFIDGADERLPSSDPAPDLSASVHSFDDDVRAALDGLATGSRDAIVLSDVEGLSYAEIALMLGIKVGTARSRVCRGRAQLRTALAGRAPHTAETRAFHGI